MQLPKKSISHALKRFFRKTLFRLLIVQVIFSLLFSTQVFAAPSFTAGMAKRNAPGPFAAGAMVQGGWADAAASDTLSFTSTTEIGSNFYSVQDANQGSIVFWVTPEWNGNDNKNHFVLRASSDMMGVYKSETNYLRFMMDGITVYSVDISGWVAGTTYSVVIRWDKDNPLDGTNYASISVNDSHSFGATSAFGGGVGLPIYVGSHTNGNYPANALIEGLTIYRRPLWDGTNGINAGNGDEINLISGDTDRDPTLVTGSWDVVFALPTNSSTGALATGTGNAWTHPHSSNLLGNGGFMLDGDAADDGWKPLPSNVPLSTNGNALSFDGGDYVSVPSALSSLSGNVSTVEMWAKITAYDTSGVVLFGTNTTNSVYWQVLDSQHVYIMSQSLTLSSPITFNDGEWRHLAFVSDGTRVIVYVDGAEVANEPQSVTSLASGAKDFHIGNWIGGSNWDLTGSLDDVRFWSTARTQTQLQDNMYKELVGTETGLAAYWNMNEGSGQTIADSTSNNNDGTLGANSDVGADDPTWVTTSPLPPQALATSEKIFAGGYKFKSDAANEGIYRDITVTAGDDWVVRAVAHSDGTSVPKIILYDQTNGAEIGSMTGTNTSTRAAPDVFIFTGEAPSGCTTLRVKLVNTQATNTVYWHQVEVLSNGWDDPSVVAGTAPTNVGTPTTSASSVEQAHSETHSWKVIADAADEGIKRSITTTSGNYYAMGGWVYAATSGTAKELVPNFQDGATTSVASSGNDAWKRLTGINRASAATSDLQFTSAAAQTFYVDDAYSVGLTAVSLTVTPATEANSTENTDEIRVDGRDSYIETGASSLTTTTGYMSFNFRPRHSAADAVKFAETTDSDAYIFTLWGDANDYVKAFWDTANTIKLTYNLNGGGDTSGTWDATGAIAANTEYAASLTYTGSGSMILNIGGTNRITLSSIPASFGTAPNSVYFGTNYDGSTVSAAGDATFSNIVFDNTAPTISLTALSPDPTTSTTPHLHGTASEAIGTVASVEFQMDGTSGSWTACTADDGSFNSASEAFTCTVGTALSDGSHTMYVRVTDSNGNTTANADAATDTFMIDATAPTDFSLESPNNSYVSSDRPTFRFKAATDAASGMAKYKLEVDNGNAGSFSIDDIPVSRTEDYVTNRYTVHYENFGDSDPNNNYITVQTKSSSDWGSSSNDGKIKEGKRTWRVKAVDNAGNEREKSANVFVDQTGPNLSLSQVNDAAYAANIITNSSSLSLTGRATDPLSQGVAAGIEKINVFIEKKNAIGTYEPFLTYSLNINDKENYFESLGKYASFKFVSPITLPVGDYKVSLSAQDRSGNTGAAQQFTLRVGYLYEVLTPEEETVLDRLIDQEIIKQKPSLKSKPKQKEELKKQVKEKLVITKPGKIFTLPKISLPKINLPKLTMPQIALPKIAMPTIHNPMPAIFNFLAGLIPNTAKVKGAMIAEKYFDPNPVKISQVKVEKVERTYVILSWETNQHTFNNKVNFGETETYNREAWSKDNSKTHKVKLTNLKPNTKYFFEVMSQGKNYSYDAHYVLTTKK